MQSSTYLDVSVVFFHLCNPFSLYIFFFNFIIHFSPVFRARFFLPLFASKSTIEGGQRNLSFFTPSSSPPTLHSFSISHTLKALLIIKHFFSLKLRNCKKRIFGADLPFFSLLAQFMPEFEFFHDSFSSP